MKTFHCQELTGHTAAILEEITAMVSNASRDLKMAAKSCFIASCCQACKARTKRTQEYKQDVDR